MYKIITAAVLMVLTLGSTLYAGGRRVTVVDDRTGSPVSDAEVLLIPIRYQFSPADSISLWRREIHSNEAVTSFKPSILDLLRRPEPGMQDTAVKAIAKYSEYQQSERNRKGGDPDIVAALRKLLYQSSDAEQVKTLLFTLGNLGHDNYFQDLEYLYTNPDPRIQQNVITMMRFKTTIAEKEKALPYFIESLQSPDAGVRYTAVAGIAALGDRSQIEPLENLLQTEKEPSLRKFTRETISRLEKK